MNALVALVCPLFWLVTEMRSGVLKSSSSFLLSTSQKGVAHQGFVHAVIAMVLFTHHAVPLLISCESSSSALFKLRSMKKKKKIQNVSSGVREQRRGGHRRLQLTTLGGGHREMRIDY